MDYIQTLSGLLQSSADTLLWTMEQMPQDKLYDVSPRRPGSWSAIRHLFHLYYLEEHVTLPNMRLWLLDKNQVMNLDSVDVNRIKRYRSFETLQQDEEENWQHAADANILLTRFRENRVVQIAMLSQFAENIWEEERETVWSTVTLRWATTKTYQHSIEHINDILKMALFWTGLRQFSNERT